MASYAQLKKQLANLQAEVESARQAELLPIIKRMQQEMATHGISLTDLGAMVDRAKSAVKKVTGKRLVKGAGTPKYRDPKTGLTWSGFGRAPAWIAKARDRTKFLIGEPRKAQESSATIAKAPGKGRLRTKKAARKNATAAATKNPARVAAKKAASPTKGRSVKRAKASSAPAKKKSLKVPEVATQEGQAEAA